MFRVTVGSKPAKTIGELDGRQKERMDHIVDVLSLNPWPARDFDLSKISGLEDCFRIRTGQFRVCYHVDTMKREITIYRFERKGETTYK